MDPYESEIEQLFDDHAAGLITTSELNKAVHGIERGYREDAQESAEQAYRDEMDRW